MDEKRCVHFGVHFGAVITPCLEKLDRSKAIEFGLAETLHYFDRDVDDVPFLDDEPVLPLSKF
jgi:hypothetical protein